MTIAGYIVLMVAAIPGIYYLLAIYSAIRYRRVSREENPPNNDFFPPISCLKPIRGLDEDAYENYASFCRQDYPEYEIVFCVDVDDPALPVLEKLIADFPERKIRLLFGSGRNAINDKIGRLTRLVSEAQYDLLVITDGDIRVGPDYLRAVAHPFRDPKVGGATTLYVSTEETTFVQELHSIGMISDFFAGILVAWQLDGVKFMFGQSIVTTKQRIAGFGGYEMIENRPADDLNVGRLVAQQAEVKLLPYIVKSVADFASLKDLFYKRVRWMTVMRLVRRQGHRGLVFTWGLIWALIAVATHPTWPVALGYLGSYVVLRVIITWLIGVRVMGQKGLWPKMLLIPLWDLVAFAIWVASFGRNTIRWRGFDYRIRDGILVPVNPGNVPQGKG
ncbi:MAG: glycosyltransferase [Candidatus Korobacteraceae bacterium]